MGELGPLFGSANVFERKAAYIALAELAEGCADYIRTKHLQNAIETVMKGKSKNLIKLKFNKVNII